jgi:GH24 family phage-related lysozyme (muramidase)
VLVEGKVNMTVVVEGVEKNLYNRYLGVWTTVSGKPLLTAWASTKLN